MQEPPLPCLMLSFHDDDGDDDDDGDGDDDGDKGHLKKHQPDQGDLGNAHP